jgi:hypothetical protein
MKLQREREVTPRKLAETVILLALFVRLLVRISTVTQDSLEFLLIFAFSFQRSFDIFVYFRPSAVPLLWFGYFLLLFDATGRINPWHHIPASSENSVSLRRPCWKAVDPLRKNIYTNPHDEGVGEVAA